MKIFSSVFKDDERIPEKYTADGLNVNPPLEIQDLPEGTKSLVLIVGDPDAQRVVGYTWIHWVRFNIPISNDSCLIEENSLPGIAGMSTYKKINYGGPNPPAGTGIHNYHFKVFAIKEMLNLQEMTSLKVIEEEMKDKILESTEIVGLYWRGEK